MESNGICNFLIVVMVVYGWFSTQIRHAVCTTPTDIRLVGGSTPFNGIVEVQIGINWERVCQIGWSFEMADHACKHLGFLEGAMMHKSEATVDPENNAAPNVYCNISPEGVVDCLRVQVSCLSMAGVTCNFPGYLGCYHHSRERPIGSDHGFTNGSMTIETCLEFCRMGRFKFAGMAFGEDCLCDNRGPGFWRNRITDNSNCMLPCKGNQWEACGGAQQVRFYETRLGTCGGKQKPSYDYISSPLFPGEYGRGSICTWKISRDNPDIESFTINFLMLQLSPGDNLRLTELESANWVRRMILVLNSNSTNIEGSSVNVSGAGFYVEFQSALSTPSIIDDIGFLLTYYPNLVIDPEPITHLPENVTTTTTTLPPPVSQFAKDSNRVISHHSTVYPVNKNMIPHYRSRKLIAGVAVVGIGGALVFFWGAILLVSYLKKRKPSRKSFSRDSRFNRPRQAASYRASFDSDIESRSYDSESRSSYFSESGSYYSENSIYDNESRDYDISTDTATLNEDVIHTANNSSSAKQIPRQTTFSKASVVLSSFVEHIYSSVYTSGKTIRKIHQESMNLSLLKKKPTRSAKTDTVPMVERISVIEDPNAPPSTELNSRPLYQNLTKYQKRMAVSISTTQDQVDDQSRILASISQSDQNIDSNGYLVPTGTL